MGNMSSLKTNLPVQIISEILHCFKKEGNKINLLHQCCAIFNFVKFVKQIMTTFKKVHIF